MNESPNRYRSGSFIVEIDGQRTAGLAAHEVTALVEGKDAREVRIFRIHRIDEHGRTEMVGVPQALFAREDAMIFHRRLAENARADFDAIRSAAATTAPPCSIRVQLSEIPSDDLSHVVMIAFPAACTHAVANWLLDAHLMLGDKINAGSSALEEYHAADPRIMEQFTLG